MDHSVFAANYSQSADDQLLCLWADRNALVPEATVALDSEIQRRGLKKESAERIKKRFDTLAAREEKGPLGKQGGFGEIRAQHAALRRMARA